MAAQPSNSATNPVTNLTMKGNQVPLPRNATGEGSSNHNPSLLLESNTNSHHDHVDTGDLELQNTSLASNQARQEQPEREQLSTSLTNDVVTVTRKISYALYLSHFLSTWNSRSFEFGSILFLAAVFPGTLLPMSVYALFRSASAFLLSPVVGRYVDKTDRLKVVRLSIVVQRIAVILSCVTFWLMLRFPHARGVKPGGLAFVTILSMFEKLFTVMNIISVERDWVVVIAGNNVKALQALNARMRRIDLICKLVGPLTIAFIDAASTNVAIIATFGINNACILIEYFAIRITYNAVPSLHTRSSNLQSSTTSPATTSRTQQTRPLSTKLSSFQHSFRSNVLFYFRHPVTLPSLSLSLVYFTVLSFAGQMITYLLDIGYKSSWIGGIRTACVLFELSATILAPNVMDRIGPVRGGLWFINWQVFSLIAMSGVFLGGKTNMMAGIALVVGVIVSRVGLWGFDLCVQVLIQQEVEENSRGSFSSVEASLQNAFEGLSYASTITFSNPDQFKVPVMLSVGAVVAAGGLYASFVRQRRGHLIHESKCTGGRRTW